MIHNHRYFSNMAIVNFINKILKSNLIHNASINNYFPLKKATINFQYNF